MKKLFILLSSTFLLASCSFFETSNDPSSGTLTDEGTTEDETTDDTTSESTTTEETSSSETTDDSTTDEETTDDTTSESSTTEETSSSETTEETTSEESSSSEESVDQSLNNIDAWFSEYNDVDENILNECVTASKTYYKDIDFNEDKATLKTALGNLMKDKVGFTYNQVRDAMYITDRDWDLSPNKNDTNPYMRLIYAEYNFDASTAADYQDYNSIWDREHIWAKAKGGSFGTSSIGVGTDMHHLRASDKPNNNNGRSSRNFGNVENGSVQKDAKGNPSGLFSGETTGGLYEPVDRDKGDVARAIFYMNLVYPETCSRIVNYQVGSGYSIGILDDLLEWNKIDPPDEFELRRNNLIFSDYQENRNIFIDCPEIANVIFGNN